MGEFLAPLPLLTPCEGTHPLRYPVNPPVSIVLHVLAHGLFQLPLHVLAVFNNLNHISLVRKTL
jgi:hypothetical protein